MPGRGRESRPESIRHMQIKVSSAAVSCPPVSDGFGYRRASNRDLQRAEAQAKGLAHEDRLQRAVERLRGDIELKLALELAGYSGPKWERFRDTLAAYGWAVIRRWCLDGRIFMECRNAGFGGLSRPPRTIGRGDADDLATETIAEALNYFRNEVLTKNVWDPTRGASLSTFFVGACKRHFSNVYARWCTANRLTPSPGYSVLPIADDIAPHPVQRMGLHEALSELAPDEIALATRLANGDTQAEIAVGLSVTTKAIERRTDRMRSHLEEHL